MGLGLYPDFPAAIKAMTRVGQVFQPNPEAQRTYERLYGEVYQHMYKQLKPLYQKIRQITGYPA
ncbi:hypothetical protein D3C84_1312020 [compost metagenome]